VWHGAFWKAHSPFLRSPHDSQGPPSPLGDVSDDRLSAIVDGDLLHSNPLLASGPVTLEHLHLLSIGPGKHAEGPLRAVLLRNGTHVGEAASEAHCSHVDGGHLCGEQGLHLIPRLHALDHGEHEIDRPLVQLPALSSGTPSCLGKPVRKLGSDVLNASSKRGCSVSGFRGSSMRITASSFSETLTSGVAGVYLLLADSASFAARSRVGLNGGADGTEPAESA